MIEKVEKAVRMREIGSTGLEHWSGRIDEEWLKEMSHDRKWKTIREMRDNDPIVGAILFAVDMLIRNIKWHIDPASDTPEAIEDAAFVESCRNDMSQTWENTISEILSFLPYGFSYHEIVYKRRKGKRTSRFKDGKIGWKKLPIRAQNSLDRWEMDDNGGVRGFVQESTSDSTKQVTIPIEKALLFRTTSFKNNPEGRSVLRNAYRPWYFKKRIEEIEGIGIERDLAGLPVIYAPNKIMMTGASADDTAVFNELKNIVRNVRRDEQEGIIMPGDRDAMGNRQYELKLLATSGQRQFNTNQIIQRYDQRIAMTILADFILLGHEKVGSFSLSSNKTSLFATAIGAWIGEIKSTFNQYAIPRLMEINGMERETYPTLNHDDIENPDLKDIGKYIKDMTGAGFDISKDPDIENVLRGYANFPPKKEEEIKEEEEQREKDKEAADKLRDAALDEDGNPIKEPEEEEEDAIRE